MEYGTSAIRTDLHTVIQNIVLQNGIVSTYNALKNEGSEDSATLNELLSINNGADHYITKPFNIQILHQFL